MKAHEMMNKRDRLIANLIGKATTARLFYIRDKCGPLCDYAVDELYFRKQITRDMQHGVYNDSDSYPEWDEIYWNCN